jgi:hypothetical protein
MFTIMASCVAVVLFMLSLAILPLYHEVSSLAVLVLLIIASWIARRILGIDFRQASPRDRAIGTRAGLIALALTSSYFLLAGTIIIGLYLPQRDVPVVVLVELVFYGWIILYLAWGISSLVLYRRGHDLPGMRLPPD